MVFHRRVEPLPQEDAEPLPVVEGPAAPGCGGPTRSSGPGAGRRRRPGRRSAVYRGLIGVDSGLGSVVQSLIEAVVKRSGKGHLGEASG